MKYLVVIPYLASAAQGKELDLAIAGWRKHFKEDYLIVLTGDGLPKFDANDIVCIESKRVADVPNQYRQHLDYVSCLKKVHKAFPESEGFVMVADDCYAVRDFTMKDVKPMKFIHGGIDYDPKSPNAWRRDAMKTKYLLKSLGLPDRNFTTHIPIWFEWDKVEELWEKFDMEHESYVIEDLYFNYFYPVAGAIELNEDSDNIKCGVYTTRPNPERLLDAFSKKIWINNSPDGWQPCLVNLLEMHYGIKK